MNKRKLDSLLWENIPLDNFIVSGHSDIKQENLDDVFWDDVDELCVNRDDNYNISISCVRYLNQYKEKKQRPTVDKREFIPGETMTAGKLEIKIFDDYTVTFTPMYCDLPILSAALENLKRKWYEEVEINPETVLMDKKDFSKRIKPIKKMVETQFEGTEYVERMKRSVEGMNCMSVSEQLTHFFEGIDMPVGKKEKKALQARNFSAHGLYAGDSIDYLFCLLLNFFFDFNT